MNSKRVYYFMLGLSVVLGGLAAFTLVYGDVVLKNKADRLLQLRLEDELLDEKQAALVKASKDIVQYEELEKTAKAVVPQDKDQARAVREIFRIAEQSGIKISGVSFPTSNLGAKNTTSTTSNPDAPGEKAAANAPTSPVSQAKPVEGINGVYALEMTITPNNEQLVTFDQFLSFLKRLENNRRTAQVTSAKIDPVGENTNSPYVDFTLTINIFVKPRS